MREKRDRFEIKWGFQSLESEMREKREGLETK